MIRNLLLAASFGFLGLTGIGCGNSTTPSTAKPTTKSTEVTKETTKTEVTKPADPIKVPEVPKVPGVDPEAIKKEAEAAKAKLEAEVKKATEGVTTEVNKALEPVEAQMKAVEGKLAAATGAEKDKLQALVKDAGGIKETIVAKLKGLGELKDLANLPKLKDEVLKLVADLKAKLDTVK